MNDYLIMTSFGSTLNSSTSYESHASTAALSETGPTAGSAAAKHPGMVKTARYQAKCRRMWLKTRLPSTPVVFVLEIGWPDSSS